MPWTAAISFGNFALISSRVFKVAVHQSAGACSDQVGCGRETSSGALAVAITVSLASTRMLLTDDVPRSMPMNNAVASPFRPSLLFCRGRCGLDLWQIVTHEDIDPD